MDIKNYARRDKILKLLLITVETVAILVLNILCNNTLLLVFHLGWNHVINAPYQQVSAKRFDILCRIVLIQLMDSIL